MASKQQQQLKPFYWPGLVTAANRNTNFRTVLYTTPYLQVALMYLPPNEEIGWEEHPVDQFFHITAGRAKGYIGSAQYALVDASRAALDPHDTDNDHCDTLVVPNGQRHNIVAGPEGLHLYTIYSPSYHAAETIHRTKRDADDDPQEALNHPRRTGQATSEYLARLKLALCRMARVIL